MCGISGIAGHLQQFASLGKAMHVQRHRGPDANGLYTDPDGMAQLAHNRLSILDLSEAGNQPMADESGRYIIVFNGELYNYSEIKSQLAGVRFRSETDTEVFLNGWAKWKEAFLPRTIGMFAAAIWDTQEKELTLVRDRLGVKPLNYYLAPDGSIAFASEIKTLHELGAQRKPNLSVWARYISHASYGLPNETFWQDIHQLPGGHLLKWKDRTIRTSRWYSLIEQTGTEYDQRPWQDIEEEYLALLEDSVRLRFRADVPVGINISGGLDSSALLYLVNRVQGPQGSVKAFSFYTGDERYDELPWVQAMIAQTKHKLHPCLLTADMVATLADSIQFHQDEPYGGIPTIAYARVFEEARKEGVIVLLDGQGMDEQWAGYDYYQKAATQINTPTVQGTSSSPVRPECLVPEVAALAFKEEYERPYPDLLRNLQYRDTFYTKIPRALRFNDRISMRSSTELREPFLDHRLFELAFQQSPEKKIHSGQGKWFMRRLLNEKLPGKVVEAPKRPLQTPQREWLAQNLAPFIVQRLSHINGGSRSIVDKEKVLESAKEYFRQPTDNSFFIWQWASLSMIMS